MPNIGREVEIQELSYAILLRMETRVAYLEVIFKYTYTLPLLVSISKKFPHQVHEGHCIRVLTAAIFAVAENRKQFRYLSLEGEYLKCNELTLQSTM